MNMEIYMDFCTALCYTYKVYLSPICSAKGSEHSVRNKGQ